MKRAVFLTEHPVSGALRALNYTPEIERIRRLPKKSFVPLGSLLAAMGPAYGSVFTRLDCDRELGIELLSQGDMFSAEPRGRTIRLDSMPRPDAHLIRRFDVLLAGAGTLGENELYGNAIIADDRLVGKYVGPDSMTLVFQHPESDVALFAYAFLASGIGLRAIRSTSYGTKILRFRSDLLETLPIPLANSEIMARVASLVRVCVDKRGQYKRELEHTRGVVASLAEMQEASRMCAKRQPRAVMWDGPLNSMSAWNAAAGGGALAHLRGVWRCRLRDAIEDQGVFNGPRFARVDCERPHGIDFMSQRDVFLMRPSPRHILRPAISDRMFFVPEGAILAGSHGQLSEGSLFGKVELASFGALKCGVTQDILRILPRDEHRAALFAFLGTSVGQALLQATAVGTSIPAMRIDLLLDLPCPDLGIEARRLVAERLEKAEQCRRIAADAEVEAIRIVEEEVLPSWLG